MGYLAVLLGWIVMAAPIGAAGATWSVSLPKEGDGALTVAPDTTVLAGSCTDVTYNGGVLWQLPEVLGRTPNCMDAVTDSEGNTYVLSEESATANPVIESLNSSGTVRWAVPTGGFVAFRTGPVIGANGSVFFPMWNGGLPKVVGYNEQTGAITLQQTFEDVTGLHAYAGGLMVVNTDSKVIYLGYDGTVLAKYSTGPPISAYEAYSNASGAGGTLFVAGYNGGCDNQSHASVEKFTPAGLVWTWTDKATYCAQTSLTATPDGGVIFARSATNPSADFTSLSATGAERWTDDMQGPIGPAQGAGYFPVRVDVNGVVALPAKMLYRCPVQPSEECSGAQVELVSEQTGSTVFDPVQLQGQGEYGFDLFSDAIDTERLYVTGEVEELSATPTLNAFAIPGLGLDYQLALQETLTTKPNLSPPSGGGGGSSGGGGSGPPPEPQPNIYVALGDSYSSGQGVPPYLPQPKGDKCDRSALAWPYLVNIDLGFYALRFSFHACSGALVQAFTQPSKSNHEPPQESWLTPSTQLVTFTWGGDNADFASVITTCVLRKECQLYWQYAVDHAIAKMRSTTNPISLARLYEAVARKAPNARVIVVGYPRFFPPKPPLLCPTGAGFRFRRKEMVWINSEINSMDKTIAGAVTATNRAGFGQVRYVGGSYNAFAGHELCSKAPDYNAVIPSHIYTSFHPNIAGNHRLAELVVATYDH
jgi:hypothetical protein